MAAIANDPPTGARDEEEPLLGRAGDASQPVGRPLFYNIVTGTAFLTQVGIWVLALIVWGAIFKSPLSLFSAHPLLNSAGLLLTTQAILVLQPTHTGKQKMQGAYTHATLNDVGVLTLLAGLFVIEYNKGLDVSNHFKSTHGILGIVVYVWIFLQALVGFTAFVTPGLYGGEANAKALYKYHRWSGYVLIILMLVAVCTATKTSMNVSTLHIPLWSMIVVTVLIVLGLIPRIKKSKLGL